MKKPEQLDLFAAPPQEPARKDERLEELASRLPRNLRLGTSSWTFPGWAGLVYQRRYPNNTTFVRESLGEYARYPLFRTVGMDRSHYAPVSERELRDYAALLPEGFACVTKVWSELSTPTLRGENGTPLPNPRFLDVALFEQEVFRPTRRGFAAHQGPFVFQVPPVPAGARAFADAVERFLSLAPRELAPGRLATYAFELRDKRLLTRRYVEVLRAHGAAHVFNWWERMPSLSEQVERTGGLVGPLVVRLLIPPGRRYADLKDAWAPFDRLVQPNAEMRREAVHLIRLAESVDVPAWILANNKAEGSSPLTLRALAELVAHPAR
ncbi:MAG: DUF72 domain-containing protein [Sandaracinus sp.]|nr:DUF72 domain-containing protein [Myxococcales bacterium]MCB9602299.1 DUF72 domain-containing protein [Sandaracinus sp.]